MKKRYSVVFAILFICLTVVLFRANETQNQLTSPLPQSEPSSATELVSEIFDDQPISFIPERLIIPKLGVNVLVESVGLDEERRMDIPADHRNAAWYNLGAEIGGAGNAVIAAHYDDPNGQPSVFYQVAELEVGDEILVESADKTRLTYVVQKKAEYLDASFPLEEVFGESDTRQLNLITCSGSFNSAAKSYTHRLVVYTQLLDS
ncbi:MAG: class F sortase [bacterium]|nr:class F sortase [bacterium]